MSAKSIEQKKEKKFTVFENFYYSFITMTIINGTISFLFWHLSWLQVGIWIVSSIMLGIITNLEDKKKYG